MHPQPPTLLLQTLRRAASLLASRPHLLRAPPQQQQQRSLAAAAAAAAATTARASAVDGKGSKGGSGAAAASPPPSATPPLSRSTATSTTSNPLLPPHVDQAFLAAARARVFDHAPPAPPTGPGAGGRRSGRGPLLAPLRGRELNSWYVTADREVPLMENAEESARLERVALRKSSGRAPPKKGQGRRSAGGKKKK
jgi:hypothetical protein